MFEIFTNCWWDFFMIAPWWALGLGLVLFVSGIASIVGAVMGVVIILIRDFSWFGFWYGFKHGFVLGLKIQWDVLALIIVGFIFMGFINSLTCGSG